MKLTRSLSASVIAAAISACTFQSGLEQTAIDYNRAADRVEKELLLLNVARASRKEGITYTGVSEMRGNFTLNAAGSLSLPFGGDASSLFTFSPSGFYRTNPSIVIKPLGTKEFQNSVASDVDAATLLLFWERGWPKEVLLHLLIEKIVLTTTAKDVKPGKPCPDPDPDAGWKSKWSAARGSSGKSYICVIENDPGDLDAFRDFQRILQKAELRPYLQIIPGDPVGPTVGEADLLTLNFVAKSHEGPLLLHTVSPKDKKDPDQFVLKTPSRTKVKFSTTSEFSIGPANPNKPVKPDKTKEGNKTDTTEKKSDKTQIETVFTLFKAAPTEKEPEEEDAWAYRLRSAEGMIYYMGELVRAQTKHGRKRVTYPRIYAPDPDKNCKKDVGDPKVNKAFLDTIIGVEEEKRNSCLIPLFVAWTGDGAAEIVIEHKGDRYFVPKTEAAKKGFAGQSLLVMALVRQLFNLSTSREDLPSTQSVVVTGGGS